MLKKILPVLIFLLAFYKISAQEISIKVTDSKTGEGLPQATVRINDSENVITNSDGVALLPNMYRADGTVVAATYLVTGLQHLPWSS